MERKKNIFGQLESFESKINYLEERILVLEQQINQLNQLQRNHLIRVKNKEEVSDEFILQGRSYLDLSPDKAWKLYSDKNFDFILLDVSDREFIPVRPIPEAIHIPWDELPDRFLEIQSRTTPLLIISEDGTSSVLACEFLVKRGYYNCNNISGGHKFWKGSLLSEVKNRTA